MRLPDLSQIERPDPKRVVEGLAIAAACGLLLGAIAHPNLHERDVAGPQILTAGGGHRSDALGGDPGIAAYGAVVPEYVLGTDWTRPRVQEVAWAATDAADYGRDAEALEPQTSPVVYDDARWTPPTRAAWRDEPQPPPEYSSVRGGPYLESDLPPPPEGPHDDEPLADDAG